MASMVVAHPHVESSILDPNRPDAWGAALSATLPMALLAIANAVAAPLGLEMRAGASISPYAPPEWLSILAWLFIYPMWGIARWAAWQEGAEGRRASWWVVALTVFGIAYPFVADGLDVFWTSFADMLALLFVVAVAGRLYTVSRQAMLWMLPSLAWTGLAAALGFATVASGWSPGFPSTQNGAQG